MMHPTTGGPWRRPGLPTCTAKPSDAVARAARQARRARRQQSGYRAPAILNAVTAWAHRRGPAPESS